MPISTDLVLKSVFWTLALLGAGAPCLAQPLGRHEVVVIDTMTSGQTNHWEYELPELVQTDPNFKWKSYVTTIPATTPLTAANGNSGAIGKLRDLIAAAPTDQRLHLDVVIDGHGSRTCIASDVYRATPFSLFSAQLREVLKAAEKAGHSAKSLSLRLFSNFCFAGGLASTIKTALRRQKFPFEMLIVSATSSRSVVRGDTLGLALSRTNLILAAARAAKISFCDGCSHNQEFKQVFDRLGPYNFDHSLEETGDTADLPTTVLVGAQGAPGAGKQSKPSLAFVRAVLLLYMLSLKDPESRLVQLELEEAIAAEENRALRRALKTYRKQLDDADLVAAADLLELKARNGLACEDLMSPPSN
jgi:hypothetical protein